MIKFEKYKTEKNPLNTDQSNIYSFVQSVYRKIFTDEYYPSGYSPNGYYGLIASLRR